MKSNKKIIQIKIKINEKIFGSLKITRTFALR